MADQPATLITGGTSGIGAAIARRLLAAGHRVAVTGRDSARLERFLAAAANADALAGFVGDAADDDAVTAAVAGTVERFGRLDNVIANAGYATHDAVDTGNPAGWRDMVLTNVLGPMLLIRASVAALRQAKGRIVLIGSVAGLVHTPGNVYGATKWAVTGLAENTRRLVTADGVGVTLVAPGRVETDFWELIGGAPAGLNLTAGAIADAVVWAIGQPEGVDVNTVVVRPSGQAM